MIRTYDQLSEEEQGRAKVAVRDRILIYFQQVGIPAEEELLDPEPTKPFTAVENAVELNRRVQRMQQQTSALLWISELLKDPEFAAALDAEIDAQVHLLAFNVPEPSSANPTGESPVLTI